MIGLNSSLTRVGTFEKGEEVAYRKRETSSRKSPREVPSPG